MDEIAAVDPRLMLLTPDENKVIPAGTLAVIPAVDWEDHERERDEAYRAGLGQEFDHATRDILPEGTLLCAGQHLERSDYPELSKVYHDTGTFYEFALPNLQRRFIVGISEEGEIQWGDGVVYYERVPKKNEPKHPSLMDKSDA